MSMGSRRQRSARRQPGRPPADASPDTRDALLEAASRLFARHGAGEVSLRRLAAEAGVTPAMVHYYFGSKEGLYDALLERTFGRVVARVRVLAAREGARAGDGAPATPVPGAPLQGLLTILSETMAAEPWVPTLVVREVLMEGGRFRERFIRDYASHMAELLPGMMSSEIAAGRFRSDLDPQLAFLSFMGMAILPFVARPVVERVLGIDYDPAFLERFAAHTHRLFLEGAQA
jgi:AcrR family transcriptional regulator